MEYKEHTVSDRQEIIRQKIRSSEREHIEAMLFLSINGHRRGKDWKPQLDAIREKVAYLEQEVPRLRRALTQVGRAPAKRPAQRPAAKKA